MPVKTVDCWYYIKLYKIKSKVRTKTNSSINILYKNYNKIIIKTKATTVTESYFRKLYYYIIIYILKTKTNKITKL